VINPILERVKKQSSFRKSSLKLKNEVVENNPQASLDYSFSNNSVTQYQNFGLPRTNSDGIVFRNRFSNTFQSNTNTDPNRQRNTLNHDIDSLRNVSMGSGLTTMLKGQSS
jgi:hypothetical protein